MMNLPKWIKYQIYFIFSPNLFITHSILLFTWNNGLKHVMPSCLVYQINFSKWISLTIVKFYYKPKEKQSCSRRKKEIPHIKHLRMYSTHQKIKWHGESHTLKKFSTLLGRKRTMGHNNLKPCIEQNQFFKKDIFYYFILCMLY